MGITAQADEVVLRLPLANDAELRAVDALDHLLARHRVEQSAAGQARFALVEACLNAIEHGNEAVEVRMAINGGELQISVGNPGVPFVPPAQTSSKPGRGHGLKIIHAFMDQVHYSSDSDGTRLEMTKLLGTSS